jgi:hypothetical protein
MVVVVISNQHSRINLEINFVLYYHNRVDCVIRPEDLEWEKSDHARYRYSIRLVKS